MLCRYKPVRALISFWSRGATAFLHPWIIVFLWWICNHRTNALSFFEIVPKWLKKSAFLPACRDVFFLNPWIHNCGTLPSGHVVSTQASAGARSPRTSSCSSVPDVSIGGCTVALAIGVFHYGEKFVISGKNHPAALWWLWHVLHGWYSLYVVATVYVCETLRISPLYSDYNYTITHNNGRSTQEAQW